MTKRDVEKIYSIHLHDNGVCDLCYSMGQEAERSKNKKNLTRMLATLRNDHEKYKDYDFIKTSDISSKIQVLEDLLKRIETKKE